MPAGLSVGSTTSLTASPPGPSCDNCGTPLVGDYCHACGQQALPGGELTVRQAFRTAADDVLHVESKTLRSLGLLFVPGLLTSRYLAGRRAPYTAPLVATIALILPYLFAAVRRVYGESHARTAWKVAVLFLFALVFDNLVNVLTVVVTLKLV